MLGKFALQAFPMLSGRKGARSRDHQHATAILRDKVRDLSQCARSKFDSWQSSDGKWFHHDGTVDDWDSLNVLMGITLQVNRAAKA